MKLYLHIGIEKTGSSYLQSLAAINRDLLKEQGIWFPKAGKREFQLQQGLISAGNAQPLTDAMEVDEYEKISQILQRHLAEARTRQCQSVLLSNELLMLALSREGNLSTFQRIVQAAGYAQAHYLLILRDPVDQALSLYKHRAKGGTAPDIEEWPKVHYHYGIGLKSFLQEARKIPLPLTIRKYRKQGLEELFFNDWLGFSKSLDKPKQVINPSLSLSELSLIRQLRQHDAWLPRFLYNRLLTLPKAQKDPELKLTRYYMDILYRHLSQYKSTWELCNQYLVEDEQLDIPTSDAYELQSVEKTLTFSTVQGQLIADFIKEAASPAFQWKMQYRKCRNELGRLKNRLLTKN